MKGSNELRLNQNSLNEAVEFYLNTKMFVEPVKVTNVNFSTSSGRHEFTVFFQPQKDTDTSLGVQA